MQRLAHAATHKLEEVKVVGATGLIVLDHTVGVGLEGRPAQGHRHKQREVGVEDLPRHHLRTKAERCKQGPKSKRGNVFLVETAQVLQCSYDTLNLPLHNLNIITASQLSIAVCCSTQQHYPGGLG